MGKCASVRLVCPVDMLGLLRLLLHLFNPQILGILPNITPRILLCKLVLYTIVPVHYRAILRRVAHEKLEDVSTCCVTVKRDVELGLLVTEQCSIRLVDDFDLVRLP